MSTRIHIVVPDAWLAEIDAVRGDLPRSVWVRRAVFAFMTPESRVGVVERGVAAEQALGSSGRAGVRGRVPASAPAEQPRGVEQASALAESGRLLPVTGSRESGDARFESRTSTPAEQSADVDVILGKAAEGLEFNRGPRVRSSSVARPFRPAPKQGKK